jgi:pantoate--beta-alanine ligase
MHIFKEKNQLIKFLSNNNNNKYVNIGFIPTMGSIHQGHLSLIKESQKKCDLTICSIYINPTQFNDKKDYENYPKELDSDIKKLNNIKCDVVYTPKSNDFYDKNEVAENYNFNSLDKNLEGKHRPGHFNGVATIVEKLLKIVKPKYAFFGEKDLQQLRIIKQLVKDKNINTEIIGCKTIRERNGLAKSSRNKLLSKSNLEKSAAIYQQLLFCKRNFNTIPLHELKNQVLKKLNKLGFRIDYFEFIDLKKFSIQTEKKSGIKYAACIAVIISEVRLIDNIIL